MSDLKQPVLYIAGHTGLAGSALLRNFRAAGYKKILTATHARLDLRDHDAVRRFFDAEHVDWVIDAAAKVGGIGANRADNAGFLLENLRIQNNLIEEAWHHKIRKFCFLGSSCIYPADAGNPIRESALLQGKFEPTNAGYALAKTAGCELCRFLAEEHGFPATGVMPCNLYGPNDHFHPENSHVLPAMVRRFCDAADSGEKYVTCWGSGTPLREFLHADDLACAVRLLMEREDFSSIGLINIGSGEEISIATLAALTAEAAGYTGEIRWDTSRPDGVKRKLMDSTRIGTFGWRPRKVFRSGLREMCAEYRVRRGKSEFEDPEGKGAGTAG